MTEAARRELAKPTPIRFDSETLDALRRWAEDEDRTVAQQVRRVVREQIPAKYVLR